MAKIEELQQKAEKLKKEIAVIKKIFKLSQKFKEDKSRREDQEKLAKIDKMLN